MSMELLVRAFERPSNTKFPELGDGTEQRFHNRELTGKFMFFRDFCNTKEREADEKRPAFLLKDTQHHTSEPLSYPGLDDQKI